MRNRAKCKLCDDIIESFHRYDYVSCKCGEIAVDGGNAYHKCIVKNWHNFLRIDDDGNVIEVKVIDDPQEEVLPVEPKHQLDKKRELIDILKGYIDSFNRLPEHAKSNYTSHYDLQAAMLVIYEILNELCPSPPHLEDK